MNVRIALENRENPRTEIEISQTSLVFDRRTSKNLRMKNYQTTRSDHQIRPDQARSDQNYKGSGTNSEGLFVLVIPRGSSSISFPSSQSNEICDE